MLLVAKASMIKHVTNHNNGFTTFAVLVMALPAAVAVDPACTGSSCDTEDFRQRLKRLYLNRLGRGDAYKMKSVMHNWA